MWPNFGKSTILAHFTHEIFSSQKQPINLKFYAMVDWVHSRYINYKENLRNTQKAFCVHSSTKLNMKILIVSCTTKWLIFQNSVTYAVAFCSIIHWTFNPILFSFGKALNVRQSTITPIFNLFLEVVCLIEAVNLILYCKKIDCTILPKLLASYLYCLILYLFLATQRHPCDIEPT